MGPGASTPPTERAGRAAPAMAAADGLVAELVAALEQRGVAPSERAIGELRGYVARPLAAGADAKTLALLWSLGLPAVPRTVQLGQTLLAGAHRPGPMWADTLAHLARLSAAGEGVDPDQAGSLARQVLTDWALPVERDARSLARWLRATVIDTGTPLEAKLGALSQHVPREHVADLATLIQRDARARLESLQHALERAPSHAGSEARVSIERLRAVVESEQLVNAARPETTDPRFFVLTIPTTAPQRGAIELSVRERPPEGKSGERRAPDVVRLKLSLERLGDVRIDLTVSHPNVACHFGVDRPFAAALLEAGSAELAARLARLGFANPSIDAEQRPVETMTPAVATAPAIATHLDFLA